MSPMKRAFESQFNEFTLPHLSVTGTIPDWLTGRFISIGPAQFSIGETQLTHWFDGFSMLKLFEFNQGNISFKNKFLHSKQFIQSNKLKHLAYTEFATPRTENIFK